MGLLGQGAIAMWWDMAPEHRAEFEHWHTHEHFPERMGIPGFRRGSRWAEAGSGRGFFVMYELESHATLSSPAYLERLNAPTPWSTKMMPHHQRMVRSQCHVLDSRGGAISRAALTVRLSPIAGGTGPLQDYLRELVSTLPSLPGIGGCHLLRHQTPDIGATTEQKIRGGNDTYADWIVVVCGYDREILTALADAELSDGSLEQVGAAPQVQRGVYELSHSNTPVDVS